MAQKFHFAILRIEVTRASRGLSVIAELLVCTSAFSGVANWQQSEKVQYGCTTTNLPLSNGIKIVSVLQRLHGEIGRSISDIQKRDGQTKNSTFLAAPAAGEI